MPFSHFTVKKIVHGNGSIKDAATTAASSKLKQTRVISIPSPVGPKRFEFIQKRAE